MPKITVAIEPQNYELIRDRVGLILADELPNQYTLNSIPTQVPTVWVGRVIPFDKNDIPAINISLSTIDFSNKDRETVDGADIYNIDVYTSAPFKDGERGDQAALLQNHRIVGLIRSILENPIYKTLDYPAPFISTSLVQSIRFLDPVTNSEATNQTVGRLEYYVRCVERVSFLEAIPLVSSITGIKLSTTDKGYYYEYKNPVEIFTQEFTPQFT